MHYIRLSMVIIRTQMMKRDDGSKPVYGTPGETATLRTVSRYDCKTNYIGLPLEHTQASPPWNLVHLSLYVYNLCTQGGSKHPAGPGVSKTSRRV